MGITVFPTPTSSSGGGYNQVLPSIQFGSGDNQTWTPLYSGCAVFHVIGGGGKGEQSFCGGGGGSGSYARKVLDITTDQCFCINIGAQMACTRVCNVTASPSIDVIAFGGCCGGYNGSPNTGGKGGCCPSGGDVNRCGLCGGQGGSSSNTFGGGAAVDIWGLQRGIGGGANGSEGNAGGGGGVGGAGADSNSSNQAYPSAGGGGGSGGCGFTACCGESCYVGAFGGSSALAVPAGEEKFWSFVPEWGVGGSFQWACTDGSSSWRWVSSIAPGIGGGGAGAGASNKGSGQHGNMFGGAGGGNFGGNGGCGAGGGGHQCCKANLGRGGSGLIIVEYLSVTT